MRSELIRKTNEIISRKSKELGFEIMKPEHSGDVISMLREEYHLFVDMRSPSPMVSRLALQSGIFFQDKSVRMLIFPSPAIIGSNNINEFILFANTANRYLFRGNALGRFWVDVDNRDFAYEVNLGEDLIEYCAEEIEKQLFEIPYDHFMDLRIPLVMLAGNVWKADMAISYLTDLREQGYVDNSLYGL